MSNLLLVLDAEGVSFTGDDRVGPDFPPSWEEFIAARQRFLDQLSRLSPDLPGPSRRASHLDPRG